jgi:hypothetical protein
MKSQTLPAAGADYALLAVPVEAALRLNNVNSPAISPIAWGYRWEPRAPFTIPSSQ